MKQKMQFIASITTTTTTTISIITTHPRRQFFTFPPEINNFTVMSHTVSGDAKMMIHKYPLSVSYLT